MPVFFSKSSLRLITSLNSKPKADKSMQEQQELHSEPELRFLKAASPLPPGCEESLLHAVLLHTGLFAELS